MVDLYKSLGIERRATPDQIRAAFKKLALQLHPDRNPGDAEAERRFKEITHAYTVLSDPEARRTYDGSGRVAEDIEVPPYTDITIFTQSGIFGAGTSGNQMFGSFFRFVDPDQPVDNQ